MVTMNELISKMIPGGSSVTISYTFIWVINALFIKLFVVQNFHRVIIFNVKSCRIKPFQIPNLYKIHLLAWDCVHFEFNHFSISFSTS